MEPLTPTDDAGDTRGVDWRIERRGTPWLGHAVAAGGGALVAIGFIAIGVDVYPDGSHDPGWVGFGLCVALLLAAVVAFPYVPSLVRAACVAVIAIAVAGAAGFVVFPGVHHVDDVRPFYVITIAAWLLAFVFGPTRRRPLFLALALLVALAWGLTEVADIGTPFGFRPFATSIQSGSGSSTDFGDSTLGDSTIETPPLVTQSSSREPNWGEMGAVAAGFAAVYLIGVALLDVRGRRGVAVAGVLPGVIALVLAVIFFGTESSNVTVAGLASVAAGLFCGSVGTVAHRRFAVWTGAFLATVGALLLTGKIANSATTDSNGDRAATIFGLCTVGFGALMIGVALVLARVLHEPPNGDDLRPRPVFEANEP